MPPGLALRLEDNEWIVIRRVTLLLVVALLTAAVAATTGARAQEPQPSLVEASLQALSGLVGKDGGHCELKDAVDDETAEDTELPFVKCDDGLPAGTGGANGIPVPVAYHSSLAGNDYSGLPRVADPDEITAKNAMFDLAPDAEGERITLDVDITLPPSAGIANEYVQPWKFTKTPRGGFPVIVLMHGCCSGNKNSWEAPTIDAAGERWHQSNAWYASQGYVVINYTARGFRNANDEGSSGTTQLDSRSFEINDYQYLVGLLADHDAQRRAAGLKPIFNVNPRKVATVGGSYGGGFSWLALTDPRWKSPMTGTSIKLAAAAPRYGWTDLVEALIPSGHYFDVDPETGQTAVMPTTPADAPSRHPIGVEKQSIVSLLYSSGNLLDRDHTTFPAYMDDAYQRLQQGEPYSGDAQIEQIVDWFLNDRSAYYQERFWKQVSNGMRVPIFMATTWTDPLFTTMQSGVAFYNKLKSINPKYPMQMYLGDYQHFVANKAKEWGDLCGDDHHVCIADDYRVDGVLKLASPASRVRVGANTRMNVFLDHYLRAKGTAPANRVWATTTICASNATEGFPVDEPGIEYRAGSWRGLAPGTKRFAWSGGGVATTTTSSSAADNHAAESDPGFRYTQTNKCYATPSSEAVPGVVQYETEPIAESFTMMGLPMLKLTYTATATSGDYWVAARLFDKQPDGTITMVTRGVCRVNETTDPDVGCSAFQLWGNGWTFEKDHTLLLEVSQSDSPMFRKDNFPSSLALEAAELKLPLTEPARRKDFRD
jgi:predicted acyl esterase